MARKPGKAAHKPAPARKQTIGLALAGALSLDACGTTAGGARPTISVYPVTANEFVAVVSIPSRTSTAGRMLSEGAATECQMRGMTSQEVRYFPDEAGRTSLAFRCIYSRQQQNQATGQSDWDWGYDVGRKTVFVDCPRAVPSGVNASEWIAGCQAGVTRAQGALDELNRYLRGPTR